MKKHLTTLVAIVFVTFLVFSLFESAVLSQTGQPVCWTLYAGFNGFACPVEAPEEINDSYKLLSYIGTESEVAKLHRIDASQGTWETTSWFLGQPLGKKFIIQNGEGYLVSMKVEKELCITGAPIEEPLPWDLFVGLNIIGLPHVPEGSAYTSYDLLPDIGDESEIAELQRIDALLGIWETTFWFFGAPIGNNFPIERTGGYFASMKVSKLGWTPPPVSPVSMAYRGAGDVLTASVTPVFAEAAPSVGDITVTDVTPTAFSVVWGSNQPSECTLNVFDDEAGTTPTLGATVTSEIETRPEAGNRGIMKVRVTGLQPSTAYYFQTSTTSGSDTTLYPEAAPFLPVTTETETQVVSNDILLTRVFESDGFTPVSANGAILIAKVEGASYPVNEWVGEGFLVGHAGVDLFNLYSAANRRTLELLGGEPIEYWVFGGIHGQNRLTDIVPDEIGGIQLVGDITLQAGGLSTLEIVSGNNQMGVVGTTLPNPLVVIAKDQNGNPVSGVEVIFSVIQGGGYVSPPQATTDASGKAQTSLTLGPTPGENQVKAQTDSLYVTFTAIGISSVAQQIKPVADSPQQAGAEFIVDIMVENVENLFGIAFVLHYTHNTDYIDALSAVKGDFLGDDVLWLDPVIDDDEGAVSIGITRKRPADGIDGSGVVTKVTFQSDPITPDDTPVDFTITEVDAVDPNGTAIPLTPQSLTVMITNQHTVTITSGPDAVPDTLPSSGGDVNLSVTAEDSLGHDINYNWTVNPDEGSFNDANKPNPIWTAPANPTASDKIYILAVTTSCNIEPSIKDTDSVQVTVQGLGAPAIIKPVTDSPQLAGSEFTVDVMVENVENLFGIAFVLNYDTTYINALSAVKGDFLGDDVLWLDPVINDDEGTVSIGITRKRPADGVDGSGIIAEVTFKSDSMTPDDTSVDFTITDIVANDPSGVPIPLTPQPLTVIVTSVPLYGDVTGDGRVTALDAAVVLQACVGLITLTPEQEIRANVSGKSGVTAYDASLILRYVVGLLTEFPVESNLAASVRTGQIYHKTKSSASEANILSVGKVCARANERIVVPISIDDASGILSGELSLTYDSAYLNPIGISTTTLTEQAKTVYNVKDGVLGISFANAKELNDRGTLLFVEFEARKTSTNSIPLTLSEAYLNEGLNIFKVDGWFRFKPEITALLPNFPNPFNPETWIPYQLKEPASVVIRIYNVSGQLVRILDTGHRQSGFYIDRMNAAYWDGCSESGERVSSGVYFYQLKAGEFSAIRKMVITK